MPNVFYICIFAFDLIPPVAQSIILQPFICRRTFIRVTGLSVRHGQFKRFGYLRFPLCHSRSEGNLIRFVKPGKCYRPNRRV